MEVNSNSTDLGGFSSKDELDNEVSRKGTDEIEYSVHLICMSLIILMKLTVITEKTCWATSIFGGIACQLFKERLLFRSSSRGALYLQF